MTFSKEDKTRILRHFIALIDKGTPPHTVVGVLRQFVTRIQFMLDEGLITEGDGTNKRLETYIACAEEYIKELETKHKIPVSFTKH
jgi:hypothetical protein